MHYFIVTIKNFGEENKGFLKSLPILKGRGGNGYHGNYLKWRMNWKK